MIKIIAIDFGGVYFTWSDKKAVKDLCKITGADSKSVRSSMHKHIKKLHVLAITEKQYWHRFCKDIGKNINHRLLQKTIESQCKPIYPVIRFVEQLRKNYKIALVSNFTPLLDDYDKKYHFYKNFDYLLSSHMVRLRKPHAPIFKLLIKRTKAKPEEIIFIDDLQRNINGAKKVGIKTILFKNLKQLKKELKKHRIK